MVIIVELVIGRTGDDEFDKGTKVKETYDAIILRSFSHHRSSSLHSGSSSGPSGVGRTIKSLPNGTGEKGEDEDVHMNEDDSDESAVEVDDILPSTNGKSDGKSWPIISHICISSDCQWLATSDLAGRTHVFNVDAVKVRYTLSTRHISDPHTAHLDPRHLLNSIIVLSPPLPSRQLQYLSTLHTLPAHIYSFCYSRTTQSKFMMWKRGIIPPGHERSISDSHTHWRGYLTLWLVLCSYLLRTKRTEMEM